MLDIMESCVVQEKEQLLFYVITRSWKYSISPLISDRSLQTSDTSHRKITFINNTSVERNLSFHVSKSTLNDVYFSATHRWFYEERWSIRWIVVPNAVVNESYPVDKILPYNGMSTR